jgi:hypothetical protein
MRGKTKRYTFVLEILGGTYVRQACGESPELALRAWLRFASEDDFEWASHREALLRGLGDEPAVPVEGCQNVWCFSGLAGDHLFQVHIIGTESGSEEGRRVAVAQMESTGADPKRWGLGDRW